MVGPSIASALSNKCTSVPTINGPARANRIANVNVTASWKYSLTLRPTSIAPDWTNIFHVTYNDTNSEGFGSRAPGLWFIPGSTRLHLVVNTKRQLQWILDSTKALPLNQETNVSIECINRKIIFSMSGAVSETMTGTLDEEPYVGPALLYASDPFYPGFTGTLTNFKYCFNTMYVSLVDNKAGNTKTPFQTQNYAPINWDSFRPANVIATWGQGPWGTGWASGFPGSQATKWIWNTSGAASDEPSWSFKPFLKKYTNNVTKLILKLTE
jgi:hypothetical protein